MLKKKYILFIVIALINIFLTNLSAKPEKNINNFMFLFQSFSDSLKTVVRLTNIPPIKIMGNDLYSDFELFANQSVSGENEIIIENFNVSFTYIPYRTIPFFKQRWVRICYVNGWLVLKNQKQIINWKFEDRISVHPAKLENPNWSWTLGRIIDNEAFIQPSWSEPVIAVGVILAIVYSIFYIRS